MHLKYRNTCRVCGSTAMTQVIDLGAQTIQGVFVKPGAQPPPLRQIPLSLLRCDPTRDQHACGLLQTSVSVPPEILYSTYWYRSGTNQTMRSHLQGVADDAVALTPSQSALVLDIGCNDGTLLRSYPPAYKKMGIDPSNIVDSIKDPDIVVVKDGFPSTELRTLLNDRRFDVVTSIAMFYDVEDPVAFVEQIKEVLAPAGVWIFEMSYMPSMLRMNSYDTICHEHLEYYSLAVLELILAKAGMKIFRACLNDINGGSIRCYATHEANFRFKSESSASELHSLRQQEFDLELDTDLPYRSFQDKVNAHRDELRVLIRDLKRSGKRIHIYGASTKGNTILQFCGIDNSLIDFAADRNPEKHGARTVVTDIPIISEEESRALKPDYYLVLPWHFKTEFLQRERAMLDAGIRMIFPLPEIEIVGAGGSPK